MAEKTPWDLNNPLPLRYIEKPIDTLIGDDPLTAIMGLCTIHNEEKDIADKELEAVREYCEHIDTKPDVYGVRPYAVQPPKKPSFVWRLWLYSTLRLVFWRLILYVGIFASAWFTLFVYRSQSQTIIPNADAMFSVLIFATGIFLNGFVERVLDLYSASRRTFDDILGVLQDFSNSLCVLAKVRIRNNQATIDPGTVTLIVDLMCYLHSVPYALVLDVRGGVDFDALPLYPHQKFRLWEANGTRVGRLRTLFEVTRECLAEAEHKTLFKSDTVSLALFKYIDNITSKLPALKGEVGNDVPQRYVNTLKQALSLFCLFLPTLVFDQSDWWWGYVFMAVLVYVLYGFFMQSLEIHNPIGGKSSTSSLDVPVIEWAHIASFGVDNNFQQLLREIMRKKHPHSTIYEINAHGVVSAYHPRPASISKRPPAKHTKEVQSLSNPREPPSQGHSVLNIELK